MMQQMKDLHHEAMELVDEADDLRRKGDAEASVDRLRRAFDRERQAAEMSAPDLALEPTRSVLHRSAATLAWRCGEYREAERLITTALSGNPPPDIAEELRDLLMRVYFEQSPRKKRRSLPAPTRPRQSS
jgi:tetratricopeptide (TPR) repeat protein